MEKLSHAYIISSASESERNKRALELAAEMLCSGSGKKPCCVCRDCMKVSAGVHPDLTIIKRLADDKGNEKREILVDQIRTMVSDAYILPNEAAGKVYIIEEADRMNMNAQNTALKLLEEPPANVRFILTAANTDKLLPTVRSRCVEVKFNAEAEDESENTAEAAEAYLECLKSGSSIELLSWSLECESLDQRSTVELLNAIKQRCADMLCGRREPLWEDKKRIMDIVLLMDRCLQYLVVNTGIRNIFGLLAVKSLPADGNEEKS